LQRWFADTDHRHAADPYFLYGASNMGSLLALAAYPALLEPTLRLTHQGWLWSIGYLALAVLIYGCITRLQSAQPAKKSAADAGTPPTWPLRLHWVLLAFVPSSLLLGVTTFATTDIAPIPLLWIIPLSLYLLTFIIAFGWHPKWVATWTAIIAPAALLILIFMLIWGRKLPQYWMTLAVHFLVFFLASLMCHMELVRLRPTGKRSTEFYLWMSFGGMLGGLFNALAAPLIFKDLTEYPLTMILACFLVPSWRRGEESDGRQKALDFLIPLILFGAMWLLQQIPSDAEPFQNLVGKLSEWTGGRVAIPADNVWALVVLGLPALIIYYCVDRPMRFGLGVLAFWLAATIAHHARADYTLRRERSFFGKLDVEREYENYDQPDQRKYHRLLHGTTLHGKQQLDPLSNEPLTYYHRTGPLGQLFRELPRLRQGDIAAIGLGTGSVAAYGEPGNTITFYEIDPVVRRIAEDPSLFTYLRDSKAGKLNFVMGDARLKLEEHGQPGQYGLIIVDAFSSDAIPIHLLTKEAVELYFSKLRPDGAVAIHVSNRYLSLEPVVARIAKELGVAGVQIGDIDHDLPGKQGSYWVVLARKPEDLKPLLDRANSIAYDGQTIDVSEQRWQPIDANPTAPLWTDDFSNILSVLSLGKTK
jgi:spermidine synthase